MISKLIVAFLSIITTCTIAGLTKLAELGFSSGLYYATVVIGIATLGMCFAYLLMKEMK